ncbi:MFS transporter [Nocardia cyriacigeorgica]|uniref:MFS transporter n=1 Tax=Nocardia cyriacigeorgica TaxID=135487 RepID=A0A5R8NL96_9NOCA|nr:MFS transporter [Nocardia cyriacigeorgica]TLF76445.1 MFS transporter [Nocardia cyriacigeorgica]
MSAQPSRTAPRLPALVYVLAAGIFLMGTTEFMIAGLLPEVAADLGVDIARAGLLVTAFAVGMIVGPPVMALLTLRLPARATLLGALLVFAAGHLVAAVSDSFTVVTVSRVVTALATGTFWATGAVLATSVAGPGASARALAVMSGGLSLAVVAGVPLGTFAGQLTGWRGPFWMLAALSVPALLAVRRCAPADVDSAAPPQLPASAAAGGPPTPTPIVSGQAPTPAPTAAATPRTPASATTGKPPILPSAAAAEPSMYTRAAAADPAPPATAKPRIPASATTGEPPRLASAPAVAPSMSTRATAAEALKSAPRDPQLSARAAESGAGSAVRHANPRVSVSAELSAVRPWRVWMTLAAIVLAQAGFLGAYSFLTPLLTDRAGISAAAVPLVLVGFGVGALGGTALGGRLGDRWPLTTIAGAVALTSAMLLVLAATASHSLVVVVLVVLLGASGLGVNPILIAQTMGFAGPGSRLASSLATAAFNLGTAVGSALAATTLSTSLGVTGPPVLGAVITASALIPVAWLAAARPRRPRETPSRPAHEPARELVGVS